MPTSRFPSVLGGPTSLRIGLLAPPWVPIPPPSYGGIEQVVDTLARGLAERGHEVLLVAAHGSAVPGVEVVSPLGALPGLIGDAAADWSHTLSGVAALADVDLVIDHSGPLGALLTSRLAVPGIHVTHGPLSEVPAEIYRGITEHFPRLRLVAISQAQRAMAPGLRFAGVRHNGLQVDAVPFHPHGEGYLAFLGRMCPEKGPAQAIRIARDAGMPLVMAAKCREPAEHEYFERHVAPRLGPDVVWLGELGTGEKYDLLKRADALVFPIDWPEPFGMVMIEAMACGTPVLATRRGSVPEVIADGVTGFIRDTPGELSTCVSRLPEIDRSACRRWVEDHFSAEAMTTGYERLVRQELGRTRDHDRTGRTLTGTTWNRGPTAAPETTVPRSARPGTVVRPLRRGGADG